MQRLHRPPALSSNTTFSNLLDLDFFLFRSVSHWAHSQLPATYKWLIFFFHQDLCIIMWEKKEVKKKALSCIVKAICTEGQWGLLWAETHPPSKFCRNLFSSFVFFCNPTDEPTNKQTDMGVNTTNSPTRSGGLQDDSCDKPPILFKQQV